MKSRIRLLPLMTALLLAGCLESQSQAFDGTGECAAADPRADLTGEAYMDSGAEPAPAWRVGDAWRYETTGARRDGGLEFRVIGFRVVNDELAFCVERVPTGERAVSERPRVEYFAVESLNQVWDECGKPYGHGDCRGRTSDLDFPLVDGKTWTTRTGGDVITMWNVSAERVQWWDLPDAAGGPGEAWIINATISGPPQGSWRTVYAPAVGLVAEHTTFSDGAQSGHWRLVETNRG